MTKISFGKARFEDSARISVLLKTVYIETYAIEGISFEFSNFIEKRFSTKHIEKVISQNPDQLIVAYCNDNPIGIAEIYYESRCPARNIPIPELSKLYLLQRFNGRGIGSKLLQESELLINEKGYKSCNLEVYVENERAIAFYERHGYKKIGKVDFVMERNTYKNWVMNKVFL